MYTGRPCPGRQRFDCGCGCFLPLLLIVAGLALGPRLAAQQQVENCGEEYLCGQGANGIELWVHVFLDRNNDGQYTEGEPCLPSQVAITPGRSSASVPGGNPS